VKKEYQTITRIGEEARERNKRWLGYSRSTIDDLQVLHETAVVKSEVRLELAKVFSYF
jgi:DNA-binding PadR family transcriptional regulator